MKLETLQKGLKLNKQRVELTNLIEKIKDAQENAQYLRAITHDNRHTVSIVDKSLVKDTLDIYMKRTLKELSQVELELAELQDDTLPETSTTEIE